MKNSSSITYNLPLTFKAIYGRLPTSQRKQFRLLLIVMVAVALFETFSLGIVGLFASAIADPEITMKSEYIVWAKKYISWSFLYNPRHFIVFLGFAVMVAIPCKNISRTILMYWTSHYVARLEAFFGEKLLNGFLSANYQWLLGKNSADLILAVQWRAYLGGGFIGSVLYALSDIVVVVFLTGALFIINPLISLCILLILGSTAFFIYFKLRKYIDYASKKCLDLTTKVNRDTTKAIHGVKDVKISGTKNSFVNEFRSYAIPYTKYYSLQGFLSLTPSLILESVGFMMIAFVVFIMLIFLNNSLAVVTGTLTLLAVSAWRLLPAINRIVSSFTSFRNLLPSITMVLDFLDQIESETVQEDNQSSSGAISFKEKIDFRNISFSYQGADNPVIKDISFDIKKGETIGIVGFSGAGKSTFVDLLIGLLVSDKGSIAVDGKKLNRLCISDWVTHIGYVSQSPYIFDGTLAENVAFGVPNNQIDKKRVQECCRLSAMDFLDDYKEGIDTNIGERGIRLSGGQQQRVAIARALYRDPDVLVFDEATSALDSKSEKAILETIYSFKGKLTMVIIAHRLSTVEKCDNIAWIDKGLLRDIDVPEKLLKDYRQEMNNSVA
jgi:ATP-binding cassette, subfamily B, bacterial PglK